MTRIRDIASELEKWAPRGAAQSFDNVGLQIGDPEREVRRAITALDFTPGVLQEAIERDAQLIITHHPLLFRPLKRVTPHSFTGNLALRAAESKVALYAIHTNIDAAPSGISFALAERLGLENSRLLDPFTESIFKLVTFVPVDHLATVRRALGRAGAGRIGEYLNCAFELRGTGHFQPTDKASPHIGRPGGEEESVSEGRLEVEVSRWDLDHVLAALKDSHPYEEVAYDVYPVNQPHTRFGFGAVGELPEAEPLEAFLARVSDRLGAGSLRYTASDDMEIKRVAVCGGSGSSLISKARAAGADAYVTGDITYHTFFDVLGEDGKPRMALVDPGHYETEAIGEDLIASWLSEQFRDVEFRKTTQRTSPVRSFLPRAAEAI